MENRFHLMKFVDEESYQIFDHIAQKYPQTSSKGVSMRIKSRVPFIDNRESDEFDFLFRNNIQLDYRADGDYSEDIMQIINKLVSFSTEVYEQHSDLQESNYEVFSEIMEMLFDNIAIQSTDVTVEELTKTLKNKVGRSPRKSAIIKPNLESTADARSMDSKRNYFGKETQRQLLIGHKIPVSVPLFSQEDIKASKFKTYDSSVLRLLAKWAEELRNKIMNPEETIEKRVFKFKNNKGRLINLEPTMKNYLYTAAIKEMEKVEEYLKYLKEENSYLQTIFA